jgi:uncharacterized protein YaiE (UPF0345 family)
LITVSTTSPREARVAAGALQASVPADIGWEVYLRGTLFTNRDASSRAEMPGWPSEAEHRFGQESG